MMAARPTRTQGLTEGAILAALVALLVVASRYFPPFAIVAQYLCPVPLAMLVIRHGMRVAAIAGVVSALIGVVLGGPLIGLAILIGVAPMGLAIGLGARQRWDPVRIIALASVVAFVSIAFSFAGVLAGGPSGTAGMLKEMNASIERSIEWSTQLYARLGIPAGEQEKRAQELRQFMSLLPYLFPGMLLMGAVAAAWVNYEVSRRILRRFGHQLATLPPLRSWRVPATAAWLLPVALVAVTVSGRLGRPPILESAGQSLLILLSAAFTVNGLIAVWVILGNFELSTRERTIITVALALFSSGLPLIAIVLVVLGLIDSLQHVRERWGVSKPDGRRAQP
jgi:uncharacterized protein YybS (DUF2232 family)